jgi:outer membrane protein assembly factor BamB
VYLHGQGKLETLDLATGNVLWKDADPGYNEGRGTPAVSGSVVVSPIGGAGIAAFDAATGRRLWTTTTGGAVESSPVISGNTVYAGAKDGKFSALDLRTGRVVWTHAIGTWVNSSAAVSGNLVLVGAYDGNVYGFRG